MEKRLRRDNEYGDSGDRTVEEGATGSQYDRDRGDPRIDANTPDRITDVNTYNVDIEGTGEVKPGSSSGKPVTSGASYDTWDQARQYYYDRWQTRYGTAGRRWEDYEPAYRYGWERSRMPDYQGRSWSDVEPGLRSGWESGHNLSSWDRIVDAVRDTWENITGNRDRTDIDRAA